MVSTVERARPRGTPKPSAAAPTVLPPASATYCSSARSCSPIDLFTSSSMVSVPTPCSVPAARRRLSMPCDHLVTTSVVTKDNADDIGSQAGSLLRPRGGGVSGELRHDSFDWKKRGGRDGGRRAREVDFSLPGQRGDPLSPPAAGPLHCHRPVRHLRS